MPASDHAEGGLVMLLLFAWILSGGGASPDKPRAAKKPTKRKRESR